MTPRSPATSSSSTCTPITSMPDGPWRESAPAIASHDPRPGPRPTAPRPIPSSASTGSYVHDLFLGQRHHGRACCPTSRTRGRRTRPSPSTPTSPRTTSRQASPATDNPASGARASSPPTSGRFRPASTEMSRRHATGRVASFKVYTAWGPGGRATRSTTRPSACRSSSTPASSGSR